MEKKTAAWKKADRIDVPRDNETIVSVFGLEYFNGSFSATSSSRSRERQNNVSSRMFLATGRGKGKIDESD